MDLKPNQEKLNEAISLKLGLVSGNHPVWKLADLAQDLRRFYARNVSDDRELLQLPILLREYATEARKELDRLDELLR